MTPKTDRPVASSGTFVLGDLPVHRMAFGAMRVTGPGIWGPPQDHDECIRVLRRAIELGVDFIDTADSYGPYVSEELICEALYPYPDGLVIGAKAGLTRIGPDPAEWPPVGRPEYLRQECLMSLRRLRLECIDLFQLHRIDAKVPAVEQFGVLKELRDDSRCATLDCPRSPWPRSGCPCRRPHRLGPEPVQPGQPPVRRGSRALRDRGDRLHSVVPHRGRHVVGPARHRGGCRPGRGATPAQVALAWLLRRSPAMLPIPGTSKVAHVEENCAASTVVLSDEQFDARSRWGA